MLLVAMAHVDRSDETESALDAVRWMTAAGIAFDKLNKPGGAATDFVLTEEFLDREIERLEAELGKVAPSNARASRLTDTTEIDKALSQTLAEWEQKIRSDVLEELTGKDALGREIDPKRWDQVADKLNGHQAPEGEL